MNELRAERRPPIRTNRAAIRRCAGRLAVAMGILLAGHPLHPASGAATAQTAVPADGPAYPAPIGSDGMPYPAPIDASGFPYRRPVEVPDAGWWRIPIDTDTLRTLGSDVSGLRLLGPDAGEIPYSHVEPGVGGAAVPATVESVSERTDGWWIQVDTGERRITHDRLTLQVADTGDPLVATLALESSEDGVRWEPTADGTVYVLGGADAVRVTAVEYPATDGRYLRIGWPASAGLPRISGVTVRRTSGVPEQVHPLDVPQRRTSEDGTGDYLLELPEGGLPAAWIALTWTPADIPVGWTVWAADGGRWSQVAEGVSSGGSARVGFGGGDHVPAAVRVALDAGGGRTAELEAARVGVRVSWLIVRSTTAGTHWLAWGRPDIAPPSYPPQEPPVALGDVPVLDVGVLQVRRAGVLGRAMAPGAHVGTEDVIRSWPIVPGRSDPPVGADRPVEEDGIAAVPGAVYRVTLPSALWSVSHTQDPLRIVSGDRQVPYVHWTGVMPSLVTAVTGVTPTPLASRPGGSRRSRVRVDIPSGWPPLTELELGAPASPFERPVVVEYVTEDRAGGTSRRVANTRWQCPGVRIPACRTTMSLPSPRPGDGPVRAIDITFDDGDNPPLDDVSVRVWQRQMGLAFAWPPGEPPSLQIRNGASAPRYDVQQIRDRVLAAPWSPAVVRTASTLSGSVPIDWPRWALVGAIGLAAVALIVVLMLTIRNVRPVSGDLRSG